MVSVPALTSSRTVTHSGPMSTNFSEPEFSCSRYRMSSCRIQAWSGSLTPSCSWRRTAIDRMRIHERWYSGMFRKRRWSTLIGCCPDALTMVLLIVSSPSNPSCRTTSRYASTCSGLWKLLAVLTSTRRIHSARARRTPISPSTRTFLPFTSNGTSQYVETAPAGAPRGLRISRPNSLYGAQDCEKCRGSAALLLLRTPDSGDRDQPRFLPVFGIH